MTANNSFKLDLGLYSGHDWTVASDALTRQAIIMQPLLLGPVAVLDNGNDQGLDDNYFSKVNIDEPTDFLLGGNADDSASAAAALQSLEAVQAQLPSYMIYAHSLPVHCNQIKTLAGQFNNEPGHGSHPFWIGVVAGRPVQH